MLNPDASLWVKRSDRGFTRMGEMPPAQAASALSTIAAMRGTVLNHGHPILETELPFDGSRFEGIVPTLSPVQPVRRIRPALVGVVLSNFSDFMYAQGSPPSP